MFTMADVTADGVNDVESSCKQVADFICKHMGNQTAERFRKEKVDKSAVLLMSDEQLSSMGV